MSTFLQVTPRLPVENLRQTIAFYTERLGFQIAVAWPSPRPTFAILSRDAASIGFFEPTEHQPGPIGYAEFYIEVTDAAGLHTLLQPLIPIEWGPEIYAYGRREFAVRDSNGYLIIFTEPTSEAPTTPEPEPDEVPDRR